MRCDNHTMIQYFEWYLPANSLLWRRVQAQAPALRRAGIDMAWLPPAYKGADGKNSVGYDVYDMYDLGEFDQKGSVETKYGARADYLAAVQALQQNGIAAICDVNPDTLKKVGEQYKVPENRRFADYRGLIACPDVDAVEVCTPNNMHVPCAMAAVQAGKPVNVEKPLSLSCQAAQPLIDLLEKQTVVNMMCFSYRFRPAVRYARHLLEQGLLGDVVSVSVEYLKDSAFWEGRRLDWRFDKTIAGTGVLVDLGVHLIDMARYLLGEFREVSADCGTVVKNRKRLDSEE